MSYEIGQEVIVYDRFRFAIPLRAVIEEFALQNDGVSVKLLESNNPNYPVNCTGVWVSAKQLEPAESAPELGFDREQALSDSVEGIIDYQMREEGALRDTIDGLRQQLAAERERADSMTRHRDEAESVSWELKARAKKAEADEKALREALEKIKALAQGAEINPVNYCDEDVAASQDDIIAIYDVARDALLAHEAPDEYKIAPAPREDAKRCAVLAWRSHEHPGGMDWIDTAAAEIERYVESRLAEQAKRNYDDNIEWRAKAKDEIESLRSELAAKRERCIELEAWGFASSFEAHDQKERAEAAEAEVKALREALISIRDMPEYDQDDAHRLREKARAAF